MPGASGTPRSTLSPRKPRTPRSRNKGLRAALLSLALLLLPALQGLGCSHESGLPCDGPITMGVASSLREVAEAVLAELAEREPTLEVHPVYGASSTLIRQLGLGAPIDLVVLADPDMIERGIAAGQLAARSEREIARGHLVLVGRPGIHFTPGELSSLRTAKFERLGLPGAAVPLGRYGRAWLKERGLLEGLHGKIIETENARATLSAFDAEHVDLAILYASDAARSERAQVLIIPNKEDYPAIRYVAALASARAACPGPAHVLDAWTGESARRSLVAEGFDSPS